MTFKCVVCGKEFEAKRPNAKCCSELCRGRLHRQPVPFIDMVCTFCGKPFKTHNSTARVCSQLCRSRRRHWASLAEFERAQAERKARGLARRSALARSAVGLTDAQMREVDQAQDGDPSLLWQRSRSWTKAQHKYAKKRYEAEHGLYGPYN